ncbi:MAG: hypothetical protein ACRCYR_13425, partial [Phycicoccus sp.]
MTNSDDTPAAHQSKVWQPAALRPRVFGRPDEPARPDDPTRPDAVEPSDHAGASDGAGPSADPSDGAGTSDAADPSGADPTPDAAEPSVAVNHDDAGQAHADPGRAAAPTESSPGASTSGASPDVSTSGASSSAPPEGAASASATPARTASSSGRGRPTRVSRPLAVFDELSVRPARSAFGRIGAHLRGLVGSDVAPGELARAWEQQQVPVSTGRRVWVAGAHGGAGTTTLAVCLAQELQKRRLDGVALVDAAPGRVGLADRLLHPAQADVAAGVGTRLERSRSLLSFAPCTDLEAAERLATDLRRVAGMTLTDGGQRLPGSHRQAEAVVVVVECSVRGIGAAGVAVEEATAAGWAPERLLLALT